MAEERRQFPRRWPHLTSLYNASPFVSRPYKEVEEWNTLRPLPAAVGAYPLSYDDTDPRESYGAYRAQRHRSTDKFGRSFVTSPSYSYDAFSTSTYNSLRNDRKRRKSRATGCLACFIGLTLIAAVIGVVVAVIIVYSRKSSCDRYRENVLVVNSTYDHDKLHEGCDEYQNFTSEFCTEMRKAYELIIWDNHICGCEVFSLSVGNDTINVTLDILYQPINASDRDHVYVGMVLGSALDRIINESLIEKFILVHPNPSETALQPPTPISSINDASETPSFDQETTTMSPISRTTISSQSSAITSQISPRLTSTAVTSNVTSSLPSSQQHPVSPRGSPRQTIDNTTALPTQGSSERRTPLTTGVGVTSTALETPAQPTQTSRRVTSPSPVPSPADMTTSGVTPGANPNTATDYPSEPGASLGSSGVSLASGRTTSGVLPGDDSNVPPRGVLPSDVTNTSPSRVMPSNVMTSAPVDASPITNADPNIGAEASTLVRDEISKRTTSTTISNHDTAVTPGDIWNYTVFNFAIGSTPLPTDSVSLKEPITVATPLTNTTPIGVSLTKSGSQNNLPDSPTRPFAPSTAVTSTPSGGLSSARTTDASAAGTAENRVTDTLVSSILDMSASNTTVVPPTADVATRDTSHTNGNTSDSHSNVTATTPFLENTFSNNSAEVSGITEGTTRTIPVP